MKRFGLLAVALLFAIGSFAADRFGYELCHRGIPIAWVALGLPVLGLAAAFTSFLQRPRGWTSYANIAAAGANLFFLVVAVGEVMGRGFLSC